MTALSKTAKGFLISALSVGSIILFKWFKRKREQRALDEQYKVSFATLLELLLQDRIDDAMNHCEKYNASVFSHQRFYFYLYQILVSIKMKSVLSRVNFEVMKNSVESDEETNLMLLAIRRLNGEVVSKLESNVPDTPLAHLFVAAIMDTNGNGDSQGLWF